MQKIPVTVVTGFLGSGKTTLIRHLLVNSGRKMALIVNEFGDLGVDRDLLLGGLKSACCADDVIELANGCLCCTVADEFLPAMEKLLDRPQPPDHILIETSGLALPKPLVKAFQWPAVRARVTVDGVVAMIDTPAVAAGRFADGPGPDSPPDHDAPLEELFDDQLAAADLVILNKRDLMDAKAYQATGALVRARLRPGVKAVETANSWLHPDLVLGLAAKAEDAIDGRPSRHDGEEGHDHDDFESFVVDLPPVEDPDRLRQRLMAAVASHDILRVKGFLEVPGKPMRHLMQAVGQRIEHYYDRFWLEGEPRASRLVVIGLKGLDRVAIEAAIRD
ncbi:MAG: cobalamin biosynthesis protein CobW [Magnetospirillum sp. WYHS-4]